MVKTQLAPRLRDLGFKGSGRNYDLQCPDHWALLGLQSSRWNDASEVSFTVNLLVVSREAWEREVVERPFIGPKPTANEHPGVFAWTKRLGTLMPEGEDKWWPVSAGKNTSEVVQEVLEAIELYGLPAIARAVGPIGRLQGDIFRTLAQANASELGARASVGV
jgi:hypothetical protein